MAEETKTIDKRTENAKMTMQVQKGKSARCALPSSVKNLMGVKPGQLYEITSVIKNKNGAITVKFLLLE